MTIRIRPFASGDAAELTRLHAAAFDPPQLGESYWRGARTAAPNLCVVAEADGLIVGYCDGFTAAEGGDVNSIATAPSARGNGVGGRLLKAFLGEARRRGASVIHLEVSVANDAAIRLYRAAGFERVGTRKSYYADGTDAAVMARVLDDATGRV